MRKASERNGLSYRALWERTPAMLQSIDSKGRLVHVSNVWLSTLGYVKREVVGRPWADFLDEPSRERAIEHVIPELFRTGFCDNIEYRVLRKDGTAIDVLLSSVIERDTISGARLSLTVMHDVTNENRLTAAIAAQNELWRVTLRSIGDGVIRTDAGGRVDYLNPVAEKLTGWTENAARGLPVEIVFRIVHQENRRPIPSPVKQCLAENRATSLPSGAVLISRDQSEYFIKDSVSPIKDDSDHTVGVVLVFYDVSEEQRLGQEIQYRATHDPMTGLYNRDEFERRLNVTLANACSNTNKHALLYVDLDQFKVVNDAAGHAAGDQLLKQIAFFLKRSSRKVDTVARLGGDEFALIVEHCTIEAAESVARKICEGIDAYRFQYDGQTFRVGASIGLVPIDERWPDSESIMRAADGACFAAKEGGRNRFHTYLNTDRVIDSHRQAMHWVRRIERALDADRFVLYWQRIMPLSSVDEGEHCEILLRMLGDDGQLVAPAAFCPSAERFGIATRIDRWVIRTILKWMAHNQAALGHVATISINLSGQSVGDREFHKEVAELLKWTAVDTGKLCFEVTETAAITNFYDATAFFETMRGHGVRFALDDFGSGVSSFGYLKMLPVDYLKIDGQFIRNLNEDQVDQATVRCIREVAQITGKKTVAECVETEEVEQLLRGIGIDYTQGFLRHRPIELKHLLKPV